MSHRALFLIAREIGREWKNPSPHAVPYIRAMGYLNDMGDYFVNDPAADIVARFLCNATGWRGDVARRVKSELKGMLK